MSLLVTYEFIRLRRRPRVRPWMNAQKNPNRRREGMDYATARSHTQAEADNRVEAEGEDG